MYSKIRVVDLSKRVSGEMESTKNLATWAVMISTFAQSGSTGKAVELFQEMLQEGLRPDKFCSSSVLSIIDMYSKCGSLEESCTVYEQMPDKEYVLWASLISGFSEHDHAEQAVQLFREMLLEEIRPDQMTLTAALTACSALHSLEKGKEVHGLLTTKSSKNALEISQEHVEIAASLEECAAINPAKHLTFVSHSAGRYSAKRLEFLATTCTPNAESIFAPLIQTNNFHSKPSDQDDAGCKNLPEALKMARPDDEAILKKLRQMLFEMGKSKQNL
ncbi:hypothetical protein VitviT2T_030646 [Vitis vinifera]|uniref:Pentatricopeptide repeat-containing protein n=1 Tax=Vitis vinifera TaxID=29760 RepID=A0ABY9E0L5_VITVI|nr:hypothetical protein VitviT2T_030646 [Vitis vinifera]